MLVFWHLKEHFSMYFGFQDLTLPHIVAPDCKFLCVLALNRTLKCTFYLPKGHFSVFDQLGGT